MKILICFDSVFGNTERVARAMGGALGSHAVSTVRVGDARLELLAGLDALIVGSPTRAFAPTGKTKRFLRSITRNALKGVKVAAFDTRADVKEVKSRVLSFFAGLFGYAAPTIAKKLVKNGGDLILAPEGFIVKGTEGPLRDGELERAADWAKRVK
jgi:flavodoxin